MQKMLKVRCPNKTSSKADDTAILTELSKAIDPEQLEELLKRFKSEELMAIAKRN